VSVTCPETVQRVARTFILLDKIMSHAGHLGGTENRPEIQVSAPYLLDLR